MLDISRSISAIIFSIRGSAASGVSDFSLARPVKANFEITRSILKVLAEFNHPVGIITKSALVLRDLDILKPMAEKGLVKVAVSVTTLDPKLSRSMEPRAAAPHKRLQTLEVLSKAGIPTVAMLAPVIPALNDHEIEAILNLHPSIQSSRLIGEDHLHAGQIPVAEIIPTDPANPPRPMDLQRHCRKYLSAYKVPRRFLVVQELPRTSSGKIRRG